MKRWQYISVFANDPIWLYPRHGIDSGFIADIVLCTSYLLIGLILLLDEKK